MMLKYNPGFTDDDQLIRSFVVRNYYLNSILEIIAENTGQSNQHLLVVGSRGSGKTTLVRRVAAEIRVDPSLNSIWYPIIFSEESYSVFTPGEFWLETLYYVADQTQDVRWKSTYEELKLESDETRLRDRALAQLMDFSDGIEKRIILVVENLNMLLGEQLNENAAWDLRHTLLNEPRLMLLGTATSHIKEVKNVDQAWFELFSTYELAPLDLHECQILWEAQTGRQVSESQVRPLMILTGGNPRLLIILASFAAGLSFRSLMDELTNLIDDHTAYFKSGLDNLAPTERKVFVALLELWDPSQAKQIASAARMSVSKVSALLNRLVNRGVVAANTGPGKTRTYQATERLFNIYYLMRRQSHPSNRVRAAVNFMVQYYDDEELVDTVAKLAEEACMMEVDARQAHYSAYQQIFDLTTEETKRKIIDVTPQDFFDNAEPLIREYSERFSLESDGSQAIDAATEQQLMEIVKSDPENTFAWTRLGRMFQLENRHEEAVASFRKASELEPEESALLAFLGLSLYELDRIDEAQVAINQALELDPQHAFVWSSLGDSLGKLERFEESEKAYKKAIAIDPNLTSAWRSLALFLYNQGRYDEAESSYTKAISLTPNNASLHTLHGLYLLLRGM